MDQQKYLGVRLLLSSAASHHKEKHQYTFHHFACLIRHLTKHMIFIHKEDILHKPYHFLLILVMHCQKHTYLLTYSMVQSPSWEANWFAASQEIPHISRNLKVHYCTHKRPPPVSILGQPNPVHIPTSHLLEIHPNIIQPSTPRSPQLSPSLRFPHQDPIHPPLLTHMRHMPSPSHSSRFYHPHNAGWGVQINLKNTQNQNAKRKIIINTFKWKVSY